MVEPIELDGGAGRAELVDGRWLLQTGRGHLGELAAAVTSTRETQPMRWVVSDPTTADTEAAKAATLTLTRDVLQLRRPLPVEAETVSSYPLVSVRSFGPGTADEPAWVAANDEAFAGHPDQAPFSLDRLHRLMGEPWFDPAGFLLAEEDGALIGFCWTKIHATTEPPLGEIFVIGVVPAVAGRGLGGALTLAGLSWLADQGLETAMLYVDADNTAARHTYAKLGFTEHHVDRVYESA